MGLAAVPILAQAASGSGSDVGRILMWVGILIVIVVVGTIVLMTVRKRIMMGSAQGREGFSTMEDMRAMVARGEMTQEEYEKVRKAMIAKMRGTNGTTPAPDDAKTSRGQAVAGDGDRTNGSRTSSGEKQNTR